MNNPSLSYKDAGVNIEAGNAFVEEIKTITQSTHRPEVLSPLGGFGGLFSLAQKNYQHPVLVSGTDGVGTKLKLAQALNKHDTIGIDLVAMCVNDIIVSGAEPLFFLDYYATAKLAKHIAVDVVKGIGEGCRQAGCALIGGETAEMPGMYQGEDYDLAGFTVGIAEHDKLITGTTIKAGQSIIGLASSGPHSNGYSLIRKIIEVSEADLNQTFADSTLGQTLLTPTRIYVKTVLSLLKKVNVHGIVHITGGGLLENIPRILPEHTQAVIEQHRWTMPAIFNWLQEQGQVATEEMFRTFNCGIGLCLIVDSGDTHETLALLESLGEQAQVIGHIAQQPEQKPVVSLC